jgi:hypothetical protein
LIRDDRVIILLISFVRMMRVLNPSFIIRIHQFSPQKRHNWGVLFASLYPWVFCNQTTLINWQQKVDATYNARGDVPEEGGKEWFIILEVQKALSMK